MKKSGLRIYTSFVSPLTLGTFMEKGLLPIFILRNISGSEVIGKWSETPVHCKELSPSNELFRQMRDKQITLAEYQKKYAIEISSVRLEDLVQKWEMLAEISGAKGVVLLSYGSDDKKCHRSVLRTIFNSSEILETNIAEILL